MKKLLLLLAVCTVLFSCQKEKYELTGYVKGIADGKKVKLEKQQESLGISFAVDSTSVKGGKFSFEGNITEPAIYEVSVEGVKAKSYVILENGNIRLDINKDSIFLNKISGTYNNDELTKFNAAGVAIQKKIRAFKEANGLAMQQAMKTKDTATISRLRGEFKKLMDEVNASGENYLKTHPKSFVSALLLENYVGSPMADAKKMQGYYDNLDQTLKDTKVGKKIAKALADLKTVTVGKRAPDFSAPDVNGKSVSLNASIGRITIIDFWASWCEPCRREMPNMVALYNEFHSKGVNIIGVSLDKTADKWKEAIAKDGLIWTQVSNLKEWKDPIAEMYGVQSIPATFVLNQYGVIVAKDLTGAELKAKIAEMLAPKPPQMPLQMMQPKPKQPK